MEKEAMLWKPAEGGRAECSLCARRCIIKEGRRGFCRVRENRGGKLYTLNYGLVSSIAPDPIEKKPLYHFYPGSLALSFGTVSCNFRCLQCQNYSISQADLEGGGLRELSPEDAVNMAKKYDCRGIAWTYNEPTIWFEYTYDASKLAKEEGLYTCYVTNGYMTGEALEAISPYLDAMNIDVKAFGGDFYRKVCKAKLEPVVETVERAVAKGIHVELTYLIVPTYNDGEGDFRGFAAWVANLDDSIPVHFSRFHPDYMLTELPPTPVPTLEKARKIAMESLKYVYVGNVPGHKGENTYCHNCGELLFERVGFRVRRTNMKNGRCIKCGAEVHVKGD